MRDPTIDERERGIHRLARGAKCELKKERTFPGLVDARRPPLRGLLPAESAPTLVASGMTGVRSEAGCEDELKWAGAVEKPTEDWGVGCYPIRA